jgi:predicted dinucleotide-binding enzyme
LTPITYYPERDGHIDELDRNETTTSELLGRHLPKSKIVKAFNAIQAAQIESNGRPKGSPDRRALPIAGDDPAAKKIVADLLDQFGFDVADAGPLAKGGGSRRTRLPTACRLIPRSAERGLVVECTCPFGSPFLADP